ncbi:MAG: hypothetical protein ACREMK_15900 [Gemmatimonadota bacterium]
MSGRTLAVSVVALTAACEAAPAGQPLEPISVSPQVFFNQTCASTHIVYTVPAGKLLVIEDASALAVNAATASDPNDPGILPNVPVHLELRTNHDAGTIVSGDHTIVGGVGVPIAGGRIMRAYGVPESNVLFMIGGCPSGVTLNATVSFTGHLLDFQ